MATILVVGDPDNREFVDSAYGDLAEVIFASTAEEARTLLESDRPSLMIGTLAFDESRFLTLLPVAAARCVNVVVVDCPYTQLSEAVIATIRAYALDAGVAAWWDMRATVAHKGLGAAAKEIRQIVQDLLYLDLPPTLGRTA